MAIYIWPMGNTLYPNGHAAFKVNDGQQKKFFNVVFDVELDDEIRELESQVSVYHVRNMSKDTQYSELMRRKGQLNSQRDKGRVETRQVEHTAQIKIKLPLMCENVWGLVWCQEPVLSYLARGTEMNSTLMTSSTSSNTIRCSPGFVANVIERLSGAAYAPLYSGTYLLWETTMLERWAREIRERIDDLNEKLAQVSQFEIRARLGGYSFGKWETLTTLMSLQQWKELADQYMGTSLVHGGRRKQLDDLIAEGATELTQTERVQLLAAILDIVADYLATEKSNRIFALVALGLNVRSMLKNRLHSYRNVITPGNRSYKWYF